MSFEKLWISIQDGDEAALEQLFKKSYNKLFRYAILIAEDRFIVEEILQDVYLKIWQNRNKIIIKNSFQQYLYRTVHNHAINAMINRKNAKSCVNRLVGTETWQEIIERLDSDGFILEKIEAEETEQIIDSIVQSLPEQCKEIFILSRYKQKSNKEIAQQFNIAENTVKTQLYRALCKIKENLF